MSSKDEKLNLNLSVNNNIILYITIIFIVIGIIFFLCIFSKDQTLQIINEMNNSKYQLEQ